MLGPRQTGEEGGGPLPGRDVTEEQEPEGGARRETAKQEEPKIHLYKRNLGVGGRNYRENTLRTHRIIF